MSNKEHLIENPDTTELKKKIQSKKEVLFDVLNEWDYLVNEVQPEIVNTYNSIFSKLEQELNSRKLMAEKLERFAELLTIKAQRGEKITNEKIEFIEKMIEREKADSFAYTRLKKSNNDNSQIDENPPEDVSKLFRAIVKKLHPDSSGDLDLFKKHWHKVIDAYKSKNLKELMTYYHLICQDTEEESDIPMDNNKLLDELTQLDYLIQAEKRKLMRLKSKEPFSIKELLTNKEWIKKQKINIENSIIELDNVIESCNDIITAFVSEKTNKPPLFKRNSDVNSKFSEEFFNNYFKK